jgi:cytochrome c biogenesis factor
LTQLGELSLWLALLMAAWCTTLSVEGALLKRGALAASGARGLHAGLFFTALATAGLVRALVGDDFSVRYVALHSGANVPRAYAVCALWSGPEGALLLSALLLGACASLAVARAARPGGDRTRAAWLTAVLGLCLVAVLAFTAFGANPFDRVARALVDGRGLDPQLQAAAMAVAPPLFLLGLAAAAVPAALAIAALVRRTRDGAWFAQLRGWALCSWVALTAGAALGLHWAYASPGWTGFWARNPARIAGAVVWLALSVLLVAVEFRTADAAPGGEADLLRRRAGRVLAAGGAALVLAALTARAFAKHYDVQLGDGQRYEATDAWGRRWTFTSEGASRLERPGYDVIAVALLPTRAGVRQPFVTSESREYYAASGLNVYPPRTVPGIRSTLAQDLYVVLSDAGDGRAAMRISFTPLVELGWIGSVLFTLGGLLLFMPASVERAT